MLNLYASDYKKYIPTPKSILNNYFSQLSINFTNFSSNMIVEQISNDCFLFEKESEQKLINYCHRLKSGIEQIDISAGNSSLSLILNHLDDDIKYISPLNFKINNEIFNNNFTFNLGGYLLLKYKIKNNIKRLSLITERSNYTMEIRELSDSNVEAFFWLRSNNEQQTVKMTLRKNSLPRFYYSFLGEGREIDQNEFTSIVMSPGAFGVLRYYADVNF